MPILKRTTIAYLERRFDQQIVHGSECQNKTGPEEDKMSEDRKRSWTRMMFVADSNQLVQQIPYQGSS